MLTSAIAITFDVSRLSGCESIRLMNNGNTPLEISAVEYPIELELWFVGVYVSGVNAAWFDPGVWIRSASGVVVLYDKVMLERAQRSGAA